MTPPPAHPRFSLFQIQSVILRLTGKDVRDLFQRISTNDMRPLSPGVPISTILTDERGRIIDVVLLADVGESVFVIGESGNLRRWIDRFIITEDVQCEDAGGFETIRIVGDPPGEISALLKETFADDGNGSEGVEAPVPLIFLDARWPITAHLGLISRGSTNMFLREIGHLYPAATVLNEAEAELLRIESGIPAIGRELTDRINPLEAGLSRLVSDTKGCYIGQEVLARTVTYDRQRYKLCGFLLQERGGGDVFQGAERVGWIHDSVYSPRVGSEIALGYLRTTVIPESGGFTLSSRSVRAVDIPFSG